MGRPCAEIARRICSTILDNPAPPGCVRTGARTRQRAFRQGPDGWLGGRCRLWPGCAGAKFGRPSEGRNRRLVRGRTSRSSGLGTCDGRLASGATVNHSPYAASGPGSPTTSGRGGMETRTTPSFGPSETGSNRVCASRYLARSNCSATPATGRPVWRRLCASAQRPAAVPA